MRATVAAALLAGAAAGCSPDQPDAPPASTVSGSSGAAAAGPDRPAAELTAPDGFVVTLFHEGVGNAARHLVAKANGDVLITRRDGTLVGLRDTDGDGRADHTEERTLPVTTGLHIHGEHLYFSDDVSVSRVLLDDHLLPQGEVETVVSGFLRQRSHSDKPLVLDPAGNLYVNVGAPSNACQTESRTAGSPGLEPCPQLERQAGIWRFPPGATGLSQSDGERYVTGTRNVIALDWDVASGALYFAMHGRDQLNTLWPDQFDDQDNAEMPAEEFHRAEAGADYGWPSTFVDPRTGTRLVGPEYGGDGQTAAEPGRFQQPLHAFPGHWAPNDLVFYDGEAYPEAYRGGAFIAWHGSWNRAPLPQEGFRVTFVPLAEGAPAGEPEDFLTGFRDAGNSYRPMGLAVAPDGSLLVAESSGGRIWRVRYEG